MGGGSVGVGGIRGMMLRASGGGEERRELDLLFESLVNVEGDSSPGKVAGKRRVVYIQDAAAMSTTFRDWWPSLIKAVQKRRTFTDTPSTGTETNGKIEISHPTTIVLGITPSLLHAGHDLSSTPCDFVPSPESPGSNNASPSQSKESDVSPPSRVLLPRPLDPSQIGDLWTSSEESDVLGRHIRLAKRLESFKLSDEVSLRGFLPGPLSSAEEGNGSGNAGGSGMGSGMESRPVMGLGDLLSSLRKNGLGGAARSSTPSENSTSSAPVDAGKPEDVRIWKVLGTLPDRRNVNLEKKERLDRRMMINCRLLAQAVGTQGGVCTDLGETYNSVIKDESIKDNIKEEIKTLGDNFAQSIWAHSTLRHLASISVSHSLTKSNTGNISIGDDGPPVDWETIASASLREEEGDAVATRAIERIKNQQGIAMADLQLQQIEHILGPQIKAFEERSKLKNPTKDDPLLTKLKKGKSLTSHEKRLMDCVVDINKVASTTFRDVQLPANTVDGIRSVVSLPLMYPDAYRHGILAEHSTSGVLLFGPPGTGKTLLCRALASESGARMLALNPSDLFQAYVGETEKLVKAAFTLARKLSPCILFVDECDNLFGGRSGGSMGGAHVQRQILTEFLQAMDGLSSASENRESNIVVIAATNRPYVSATFRFQQEH